MPFKNSYKKKYLQEYKNYIKKKTATTLRQI